MGPAVSAPVHANADVNGQADVNVRMLEELREVVGVAEGAISANANADVNARADVKVRLLEKLRHIVGVAEGAVKANANADVRVCDALKSIVGVASGAIRADTTTDVRLFEKLQEIVGIAKGAITVTSQVHFSSSVFVVSFCLLAVVAVVFIHQLPNVNQHAVLLFRDMVRTFTGMFVFLVVAAGAAYAYYLHQRPNIAASHKPNSAGSMTSKSVLDASSVPPRPGFNASNAVFDAVAGSAPYGYFKKHRIVSTGAGRGVWLNVNNKQLVYENMADAAKAAATMRRYPDLVKGHHHNATFGL
eukprot:gene7564-9061_t